MGNQSTIYGHREETVKVKEFTENAIAEYEQVNLEDVFGTPDKLKAYRLLLAADEVVNRANDVRENEYSTGGKWDEFEEALLSYDTLVNELGGGCGD